MVDKFIKKPVAIEAVQWDGSDTGILADIASDIGLVGEVDLLDGSLIIHTMEGNMRANKGDWIIKGVRGELYPCREDIFNETYERVEN